MASTRTRPDDSAATVKPQRIDFANESSTDFRSSGFLLLDRNDWFALHQHDARADALELHQAPAAAAGSAIETDVVRAEAGRQARSKTGSRYRTARSRGTCRRFAHPSRAGSNRRVSSCPAVRSSTDCGAAGRCCCCCGLTGFERPDPRAAGYRQQNRLFQHDHSWRVVILTCAAERECQLFRRFADLPWLWSAARRRCGPARPFARSSAAVVAFSPRLALFPRLSLHAAFFAAVFAGFLALDAGSAFTRAGVVSTRLRRFVGRVSSSPSARPVPVLQPWRAFCRVCDGLPRVLATRRSRCFASSRAASSCVRRPRCVYIPGIDFVLSAHMRNLSNAPTPPTSAEQAGVFDESDARRGLLRELDQFGGQFQPRFVDAGFRRRGVRLHFRRARRPAVSGRASAIRPSR